MSAYSLEIFLRNESSALDADLSEGGDICVDASKFKNIVSALSGEITLANSDNGGILRISCGNYSGDIAFWEAEGITPEFKLPEGAPGATVGGEVCGDIIGATAHAICEGIRSIDGLHLNLDDGRLIGVGTDGKRLALAGSQVDNISDLLQKGITICHPALRELSRLPPADTNIWIRKNDLIVQTGGLTLLARLLADEYPKYRTVIPTEHPNCSTVSAGELAAAVKRVSLLAKDTGTVFEFRSDCIHLSAKTEAGVAVENVHHEMEGEPVAIMIPHAQLLQTIAALDATEQDLVIKFGDSLSPLAIFPSDHGKWDERVEVIMPMRMDD